MKKIIIILCLFRTLCVSGQIDATFIEIHKNLRPDTITTYFFNACYFPATKMPNATATSNFSFKTKNFKLKWLPARIANTKESIDRSLKYIDKRKLLDTLECKIFGEGYTGIVIESKRKLSLFLYQNKTGYQDIFIAEKIKKNKLLQAMDYIEAYLHQ